MFSGIKSVEKSVSSIRFNCSAKGILENTIHKRNEESLISKGVFKDSEFLEVRYRSRAVKQPSEAVEQNSSKERVRRAPTQLRRLRHGMDAHELKIRTRKT